MKHSAKYLEIRRKYIRNPFFRFMVETHLEDDSPAGDLARDMNRDPYFPRKAFRYDTIENYLFALQPSQDAIITFKECYDEYIHNVNREFYEKHPEILRHKNNEGGQP